MLPMDFGKRLCAARARAARDELAGPGGHGRAGAQAAGGAFRRTAAAQRPSPARWPTIRRSSSPMNRRATWIRKTADAVLRLFERLVDQWQDDPDGDARQRPGAARPAHRRHGRWRNRGREDKSLILHPRHVGTGHRWCSKSGRGQGGEEGEKAHMNEPIIELHQVVKKYQGKARS